MTDRDDGLTRHAQEVFKQALDLPPEEREAFLDERCASADLRGEVDSLLSALHDAGDFLEMPAVGSRRDIAADEQARRMLGRQLGHYTIKSVIASGGMATVYEANQDAPRRRVALKVMRPGMTSRSATRRFEFESQILARLRHAGIAQVYETGTFEDGTSVLPYFAMEYVPGHKAITDYASARNMGTRERINLFMQVCEAVSHGHQKGIIHRDLKPSNILVSGAGDPKIIDFGIARATDSDMVLTTLQTDVGQLIGTLQYMSPEQCEADPDLLDVRSDVYSLGVVLFELLCGQVPYDVKTMSVYEASRVVRESKPRRPSTINKALRGDLETIVLKAMEKDPARRYRSAASLADDLRRYMNNEPISARPPSASYHLRKFAHRHKAAVAATAIIFILLVAGILAERRQRVVAERATADAVVARDESEAVTEFLADMLAAVQPSQQGKDATVREVLDGAASSVHEQFAEQQLVEARLRLTIGETYLALGLYKEAEEHMRAALVIRRRELGEEAPETLRAMSDVGLILTKQARYDEAESLLIEILDLHKRVLGEESENTTIVMNNLAELYIRQMRHDEAEALHLQILDIRRRVFGPEHHQTLGTMSNLAMLYGRLGRYDEAEPLYKTTLDARRRTLGDEHPDTLRSLNNLGFFYSEQSRTDEAIVIFEEAVALNRRVLGSEHPLTQTSINNLAVQYTMQKRYSEAQPLFAEVLDFYRKLVGASHPSTLLTMTNLATLDRRMERYDEAVPKYEEVITLARGALPAGHIQLAAPLHGYAVCLRELDRFDDSEEAMLEAYEIYSKSLSTTHPRTVAVVKTLVELYEVTGKPDQVTYWRTLLPAEEGAPGG